MRHKHVGKLFGMDIYVDLTMPQGTLRIVDRTGKKCIGEIINLDSCGIAVNPR